MMKINTIASQPDRVGRHLVRFEDGTSMRLYRQTIMDHGLYPGLALTPEQFEKLQEAAGAESAKMRAVRILSATSVSKKDMEQRLIRKGEDPAQAKDAVQWLSELELLDDKKMAQQVVSRCISKGYGLSRAKQALYEKKVPKEYWQEALEDYPDQEAHILAFLQDRLPACGDEKALRKAVNALIRRGHNYSLIRKVLEQLSLETEEFLEE